MNGATVFVDAQTTGILTFVTIPKLELRGLIVWALVVDKTYGVRWIPVTR